MVVVVGWTVSSPSIRLLKRAIDADDGANGGGCALALLVVLADAVIGNPTMPDENGSMSFEWAKAESEADGG